MQLQMSCNKARLRYSRRMDARSPDLTRDAAGWRNDAPMTKSLAEVNASVALPIAGVWWRRLLAFVGPGYLVSVGYMDPGNWATDLAGGSKFGYTLLSVILLSNFMAVLLQLLAGRRRIRPHPPPGPALPR